METAKLEFPLIQGHENVGTVAAIGGDGKYTEFEGSPLQVGDRVVVGANVSCGYCYYCRHDFPYCCCENTRDYGNLLSAKNPPHLFGGWSQYCISCRVVFCEGPGRPPYGSRGAHGDLCRIRGSGSRQANVRVPQ